MPKQIVSYRHILIIGTTNGGFFLSTNYMSKPGDTLYKIMEKFGLSFEKFEEGNDINNLKLMEKQMILIPQNEYECIRLKEYYTQCDDTLVRISNQYNATLENIKYFNPIDRLILQEKQHLSVKLKVSPNKTYAYMSL